MGKRQLDSLEKMVTYACIVSFSIMAIMGVLQVLFRYFLQQSLDYSEELCRYTFIWSIFFGSVICYRRGSHAAVEIFVNMMPTKARKAVLIISNITCAAFFILLVIQGCNITIDAMDQSSASLGVSMAYAYAAVPVGALLLFVFSLEGLWNIIRPDNPGL